MEIVSKGRKQTHLELIDFDARSRPDKGANNVLINLNGSVDIGISGNEFVALPSTLAVGAFQFQRE
jgi:hypothetical protein